MEARNYMLGNEYDIFLKGELFPEYPFLAEDIAENARQNTLLDIVDSISAEDINVVYNSIYNSGENSETRELVEDLFANSLHSLCEEDYVMAPNKDIYIYEDMIEINNRPSRLNNFNNGELQETEAIPEIISNTVEMEIEANTEREMKIEVNTEQEIKDEVFMPPTSNTLPVLSYTKNKNKADIKTKNRNVKGKKKTKKDAIAIKNAITIKKVKTVEQENCVDVETIPRDEIPILEAHDAKSLLEKFEACENPNPCNKSTVKNDHTYDTRPNKTCQVSQECRASISEKSVSQASNQQTSILSKNIINKTKLSERKKTSPITATQNIKGSKRKSTRMQDGAGAPSNKILKIDSTIPNDAKSTAFNRTLVQLDHDYCNNDNFYTKSCNSNKTKHKSVIKLSQDKNLDQLERCHNNGSSNEQCHLESANICNGSGKPAVLQNEMKDNWLENDRKDCQKKTPLKLSYDLNNLPSVRNINISNASPTVKPLLLSIRSPLARKIILQSQKHVLPKTNIVQTSPKTQYISVLKNPPNASPSQCSINNPNENMITTINNSNNEIQNIIVQNTQDTLPHEEDKTSRVKISVLEYRKRILNDKTRNNKPMKMIEPSRTVLVDVYHASTMKPPLRPDQEIKDTFWCEREILPCWKKESDVQKEKNKPKPSTRDVQTETDETIFEYLKLVDVEEEDEKIMEINKQRENNGESTKNKKQKSCERVSHSLSRSRSKSRSRNTTSRSRSRSRSRRSRDRRSRSKSQNRSRRSRSKSRTRNRNRSRSISTRRRNTSRSNRSSSRSRSRSRSRVDQRSSRRTISHRTRRSSVTSTSSWSSPASISMTSKHSYSRSRSRSHIRSRSRSRSRSSEQFYSKRSRSPSTSNLRRNKWSNERRKDNRDRERSYDKYEKREKSYDKYERRERSYDKYEKRSFANHHDDRSYSRSPLGSYSETYDNWHDKKKRREIEERRVVYVGRIDEGITKSDLRKRFEVFGPVEDISVHFRENGENYGFITFSFNNDAYEAVEHGNDDPSLPEYTLSFGGRRAFCKSKYADLDNVEDGAAIRRRSHMNEEMSYDYLLKSTAYMLKKKV